MKPIPWQPHPIANYPRAQLREIHLMTIQMPIDPSRKDVHYFWRAQRRIVLLTPQYRSTYAVVAAAEGMPFASAPSVSCFLAHRQQQPRAPLTGLSLVLLGAVSATSAQREATARAHHLCHSNLPFLSENVTMALHHHWPRILLIPSSPSPPSTHQSGRSSVFSTRLTVSVSAASRSRCGDASPPPCSPSPSFWSAAAWLFIPLSLSLYNDPRRLDLDLQIVQGVSSRHSPTHSTRLDLLDSQGVRTYSTCSTLYVRTYERSLFTCFWRSFCFCVEL